MGRRMTSRGKRVESSMARGLPDACVRGAGAELDRMVSRNGKPAVLEGRALQQVRMQDPSKRKSWTVSYPSSRLPVTSNIRHAFSTYEYSLRRLARAVAASPLTGRIPHTRYHARLVAFGLT